MNNDNPLCPECNRNTNYIVDGNMKSYWGQYIIEYQDVPMYICGEDCDEIIYSLQIANITQNITKILDESRSEIKTISLKNILNFIKDDVTKQNVFFDKLRQKEIHFRKDETDIFYIDELQLLRLKRYGRATNFNDQIQLAARNGDISTKDAKKIIELISIEEDEHND